MEINFASKTMTAYRECLCQIRRAQLSMESVVPDINDDIGRILSVQTELLLKSKELTARGVTVGGEVNVAILYINELENAVSALRMTQSFSIDYEVPEPEPDMQPQIRLSVSNVEARALNPRKVSVTVEVSGELSAFRQEAVCVETELPEAAELPLHTRREEADMTLINAVCEKSFVLNEQFPFTAGKATPRDLVFHHLELRVSDRQLIGSKVLLKGSMQLHVCCLTDDARLPLTESFAAPFSQLIDIGQEQMENCCVRIEPTSVYFTLVDTINGDKALDAEIHAVVQLVSRCRQSLRYLSDAYCNLMPASLRYEPVVLNQVSEAARVSLSTDEQVELPENCADVLAVFPTLGACLLTPGKASAQVYLDVLYRTDADSLSSLRRTLALETAFDCANAKLLEQRLADSYFRPDGNLLSCRLTVEAQFEERKDMEISAASCIFLDEEKRYDSAAFPAVTAVRVEKESVWDLAKAYHSSAERIEALNDIGADSMNGRLLLIPKSI